ncbi:uncharacterized protein LOC123550210 [Mercenaria mercenaria]|uniref:uncharacterized protein LOC123550210 n=1 Tax=Mercenaria mercenaria TaxID=6596 RepID=UPI00234E7D14|nr:uncharacterized protein LOC123550210 [Mercenaria mercenaria]
MMSNWNLVLIGVLQPLVAVCSDPMYVWPLANVSLYRDVIGSQDVIHDEDQKCFSFVDGPKGLPYSVLDIEDEDNSCFDVNLKGTAPLRDLTISMYVFPHNDEADISGTLIHYQSEDREILRIRTLANTFLVSFRDEYGMSAGMMYLVNFLTPRVWNHVTVSRKFPTGRIIVYKDGVEMYNEDDEFSDVISFPHTGKLRIGKSQDPDDEALYNGQFACVQLYDKVISENNQEDILNRCKPENWKTQDDYYFEVNDGQWCLADRPSSDDGSLVTLTVLSRGSLWQQFLLQNSLQDSGRNSGYLKLMSRDKRPSLNDDLIGQFNVTETKVCTRLCMRVDGCVSVLVGAPGTKGVQTCAIYDDTPVTFVDSPGSKFYILAD